MKFDPSTAVLVEEDTTPKFDPTTAKLVEEDTTPKFDPTTAKLVEETKPKPIPAPVVAAPVITPEPATASVTAAPTPATQTPQDSPPYEPAYAELSAYEPSFIDRLGRMLGLGGNRDAASVELAARRIAKAQGITVG